MSKYRDLIKEARKPENQKSGKLEKMSNSELEVNLSIKVAARRRRHWVAEAKRQGTTLTAAITEALSLKFGEPE
jgi:macrodomain Ter protein organizer (MatP/YcbG family)